MTGRHELKYLCTEQQLALIEARLALIAQRDLHSGEAGTYRVSSLYFDDYSDACLHDNEAGNPCRSKYRARYYGNDLSTLHLEKKVRRYGMGYKYSCPMTPEQLDCFLTGRSEQLLYDTPPLLRELAVAAQTRLMQPKVTVRYERTPFVCYAGNVRITLDRAICGAADLDGFLTGDEQPYPVLETGQELLEVKFDTILPGELRQAVYLDSLKQTSFSKYQLCRLAFGRTGGK